MTRNSTKPTVVKTILSLPTVINEPSDDLLEYFVGIFGRKGIGKSSLASTWPEAINFQTEPGRRNLPILMVPKKGEPPLNLETFNKYFQLFLKSDNRVAVIDTIDGWYDLVCRDLLVQYGHSNQDEMSKAGDAYSYWADVQNQLENCFLEARDAGKTLVVVSHEKAKQKPNSDGTALDRVEMTCAKKPTELIQRYCDFVFHYDWVTNDRVLTIRNRDNLVWTSCGRNDMFLDHEGNELNRIKMPSDPESGFDHVEKAFKGGCRDYDYKPPKTISQKKFQSKVDVKNAPKKTGPAVKK